MKALDILLRVWYAESMKVEFTEQELTIIAYGLEDHISELTNVILSLDDTGYSGEDGGFLLHLRTAHDEARNETRALLAKVGEMIHNA